MTQYKADVLVYGRTFSAMAAAIGAAQALAPTGGKVLLVLPTNFLGGAAGSGLLNWDFGTSDSKYRGSWIGAEFFNRILTRYGDDNNAYRSLSRHNMEIGWEMLRWYGVPVLPNYKVSAVALAGALPAAITQVSFIDGSAVTHTVVPNGASMNVIEADYESDLGRLAFPAGFVIGREAVADYAEPNAGFNHFPSSFNLVTPFKADGVTYLNGLRPYPIGALEGEGDGSWANHGGTANIAAAAIQPMGFRLPVARRADGFALPWKASSSYNPEFFSSAVQFPASLQFNITSPATQGIFERNFDLPSEWAVEWANGTWASRGHGPFGAVPGSTWDKCFQFENDYYFFLSSDPSVPAAQRALTNLWGPVSDEWFGNNNWPYEPYIREGHNMMAWFRMTQQYVNAGGVTRSDGIAVASYSIDIHTCAKWVYNTTPGASLYWGDNGFNSMPNINAPGPNPPRSLRLTHPYQQPWASQIFNPATGVTNYAASWNNGATHIARGSDRMEPEKIYLGSAIGYIAARSIVLATPLASMNIPNMQTEMVALGHVVTPPA